jgi:predicted Mrr-cat superfamily restriction endonuclease
MEGRNVFILRLAPLEQDLTQEALEKDEIFVGWKEVKGLLEEGLSFDDFRERVKAAYKIENNLLAANFAKSLWWFLKEMKPGDYVVVPLGDQFYVAEVVGDPYYDESHPVAAHRRPVRWLNDKKPIPRELASDALRSRMRTPGTLLHTSKLVADILVADIEKVLEDAKRGETPNLARELRARMVETVRQELTQGRMNPDRFEKLVERMTRAMGAVEVKRVPRGSDQGADVIADFQLMGGLLVTVGIQAKFYQPGKPMGKDAVKQLADALRAGVAEMGLVITTGDVSEEAYQAAEEYLSQENLRIGILGGRELAELIVDKGLWSAFDF